MPAAFSVPQSDVDIILADGSNRPNNRLRICDAFQKQKPIAEIAAILKKEYGTAGKGFIIGDTPYTEWFDKDGIRISRGRQMTVPDVRLSYEQAAVRIGELLEAGRYLSDEELRQVEPNERKELAETLWSLFREGGAPEPMPIEQTGGFPDDTKRLAELLSSPDAQNNLLAILDRLIANEEWRASFPWYLPSPEATRGRVCELSVPRKMYTASNYVPFDGKRFLSENEINYRLSIGSGFEHGKFRIASYFLTEKDHAKRAAFLKGEYGIGGSSASAYSDVDESHDAKGIRLSRGGLSNPYDSVLLSWTETANRIDKLLKRGAYLTDRDMANLNRYEKEQVAASVFGAYAGLPDERYRPFPNGSDYDSAVPMVGQLLDDHEKTTALLADVSALLAETPLLDRYRHAREECVKLLGQYADGTLNLFPGLERTVAPDEPEPPKEEEEPEAEDDEEEPPAEKEEQSAEEPVLLLPPRSVRMTAMPAVPFDETGTRINYVITDDALGEGGPKEKFRRNIEAIGVLKTCEAEKRLAGVEEQEILAHYVGWGGLADAFDETKEAWANEYHTLRGMLTDEEYKMARASTLNAFYTPPIVIKAMYRAIGNMGFTRGNILEPSCGIGSFMGLLPESMRQSKLYGVELDSITGRIAAQLYQQNTVAIQGYESTELPDSFFDLAVGNVPFGDYKLNDKRYNRENFLIHDYFFAKTLDKVRPGGVIAFITSSGTMDKRNGSVRRYIASRADLIGAIRLPNTAFAKNAGTDVTSDILFLQKKDRVTEEMPAWTELDTLENGITVNRYFVEHPDMILGEMRIVSGPLGEKTVCVPHENESLEALLDGAVQSIHGTIPDAVMTEIESAEEVTIPADPNVKNFSYTLVDGKVYYRENSVMVPADVNETAENRIKGMIGIRECVRKLIDEQLEGYPDAQIALRQEQLNTLYDAFTARYGLINARANSLAFSDDGSYFLLCSLEIVDENGALVRKADMFTKRTIGAKTAVNKVGTASEALAVSIGEKAKVDMPLMVSLTGKTEDELYGDLKGVIFINPQYEENSPGSVKYLTADEYLSGNVREKLRIAREKAASDERFTVHVLALEKVQPKDLSASEITVRLGSTWLPPEYIKAFVDELLSPSWYAKERIDVRYSELTGEWTVTNKSLDHGVRATNTYGTARINAYKIIEETLNLKDVRIFDYVDNGNGGKTPVLNRKETTIAIQKQDMIKAAFGEWIWKDPARREILTRLYNDRFNATRPREYDGTHIRFDGMNPEISLRKHQKDAAARILYGGNTLLGHVVGAGKTWTMAAAAMESKRLGLCSKPLFVVPNHLTEQWASEFLQLYPAANILVATRKDFETRNRKKFCGRIATGDYDAVIIGHSQFEKIPMSPERQKMMLERQMREIMDGIEEAKSSGADRLTVKQLERAKKGIAAKLDKLNDQTRKDDVVTFEELGVDRLFVDEAHGYKNLYLYTKMRNVGGISQTEALKSSDLFMKTQYLDELTGGKGVIFATGTPISNSMVELYTMQRYLQYETLKERHLQHFDAWASTFGETVTAIELAPEGSGYRAKTRFAKFFNLPELMAMFKDVADIQTADMLHLPTPSPHYHTVAAEPSDIQKSMVAELAERAERVRSRMVDPSADNMLKITNDGRKLALDQRLISALLPDDPTSKVSLCTEEVMKVWRDTEETHGTQLVFCDLSTPKADGTFNVYDDIRGKLIDAGVPEQQIAYIHDADTEVKKKELFAKVRSGDVRILLGSTAKMGAGTNVQRLLVASHDLDCPWRPADLEQRAGRIIRQGNTNSDVQIFRYVTKDTFDSYMWQLVENKQKFISQIMTSKSPVRSAEDIDETALSYAEIKALATGNPHIKEKMDLDTQVAKLQLLKSSFLSQKYDLEDKVIKYYPKTITALKERIEGFETDCRTAEAYPKQADVFYPMVIGGVSYTQKEEAGKALIARTSKMTSPDRTAIGSYRGFDMALSFDTAKNVFHVTLIGTLEHTAELGGDVYGNIQRLDNLIESLPTRLDNIKQNLSDTVKEFETAKTECRKTFPQEDELREKAARLAEVNALLDMGKDDHEGAELMTPSEDDVSLTSRRKEDERGER